MCIIFAVIPNLSNFIYDIRMLDSAKSFTAINTTTVESVNIAH
jgi:hypothetical protein